MRSKQPDDDTSQKRRLIDSALSLFAAKGVAGVTMRELTKHAGANLGAVNYHFGSKDALAEIVFMELAERLNRQRRDNLRQLMLQAAHRGALPSLEQIIGTLVDPYLTTGPDAEAGQLLTRFILMHRIEPTPMTQRIIRKHFDPMAKEYVAALALAAPAVAGKDIFWRYIFVVNTVVLTVCDRSKNSRLARLSSGLADSNKKDELKDALMQFIIGGMRSEAEKP